MPDQPFYAQARRKWRVAAIAGVIIVIALAALLATRNVARESGSMSEAKRAARLAELDSRLMNDTLHDARSGAQNAISKTPGPLDDFYDALIRAAGLTRDSKLEACGFGPLRIGDIIDQRVALGSFRERHDAFLALIGALKKSTQEIDQALALHLSVMLEGEEVAEKFRLDHPECADEFSGKCSTYDISRDARAAMLQPLIDLALRTSDPSVYAMAHAECRMAPKGSPACNAITTSRWIELDPDNAVPRALLAAEKGRKEDGTRGIADTPAIDQLFAEAAAKRRYLTQSTPYQRVMALPQFGELPLPVQQAVVIQFVGKAAASDIVINHSMIQYCLITATQMHSQRVPVCARFADLVDQQGREAYSPRIAALIGEAGGWPAEKVKSRNDEYQQITNLMFEEGFTIDMFSCDAAKRHVARMQQVFEQGELATYRALREAKKK